MITDGLTPDDLVLIEMDVHTLKKRHESITNELHDLGELVNVINNDPCFLSSKADKMLVNYLHRWGLNFD